MTIQNLYINFEYKPLLISINDHKLFQLRGRKRLINMQESTNQLSTKPVRYRINLILLVLLVIGITVWFQRHLRFYFTESTMLGSTITLWGFWKLVQTWVKWGLDQAEISFSRKLLGRSSATEYLIFALIIIIFLFFSTSSIYLDYKGAEAGESSFTVAVTENQNPFLDTMRVTSFDRIQGKPFFLRFHQPELKFSISYPRGFESFKRKFNPWSNIYLRVPFDFERKEFHAVCLVPSPQDGFLLQLPKEGGNPDKTYFLRIKHKGNTYSIQDLRRGLIYTGIAKEDFQILNDSQNRQFIIQELKHYLIDINVPANRREDFISQLISHPYYLNSDEFSAGDSLTVQIGKVDSQNLIINKQYIVSTENSISFLFMEVNNE